MTSKIRVAESLSELNSFLEKTISQSNFELSPINLSEQDQWNIKDGFLSHKSGGFFNVTGLKNNVTEQEHLVLFQPQNPLTGLALCRLGHTVYVLLQARIEPGNTNVGQFGPTIQSTPANYQRLHGGKSTAYLNIFSSVNPGVRIIESSMQLDIGERYFQKSKSHIYVELDELIATEENMIWAALPAIADSMLLDNYLNTDLRSLLGIFDWDCFIQQFEDAYDRDLSEKIIYQLIMGREFGSGYWNLIPLTRLTKWVVSDQGVEDASNSGLSVGLYRTVCKNREVSSWVQPLMKASNQGLVRLFMRDNEGEAQFLLSLSNEFGVSGQHVISPSHVTYPSEKVINTSLPADSVLITEIVQSEEGGRFFQHESMCQLIQVIGEYDTQDNQYWVSGHTLKKLLNTSNMVSIQLRCMASLIIKILNPSALAK